ncbi:hypothetical protein NLJ89_g5052 [Agrocybe chaxingu]|uniref:Uncharacterized protein n=1 Tax=Agrocybe chaxingu TaxID=84603 RepID=A0A9W8K8V3_9AGAR|nr:hypothetical protein NLJ89_g5052 [Agrocybe chaxingu]
MGGRGRLHAREDKKKDEHKKEEHKKDEHKKDEHKKDEHKEEHKKAEHKAEHAPAHEQVENTETPVEETLAEAPAHTTEAHLHAREFDDLEVRFKGARMGGRPGGMGRMRGRDLEELSAREWEELEELAARDPFLGKIVRKAGAEVHAAATQERRDLESVEELATRAYFDSAFDELD